MSLLAVMRQRSIAPARTVSHQAGFLSAGLLLLILVLLQGCSAIPWFGRDKDPTPPSKLPEETTEVTATTLWSDRLTKGSGGRRLYLVPAIGGGRIFVADARGRVVAVDAERGRILWERDTDLPLSAGPELAGDRLILGTTNGLAVALSASGGQEQWRASLSGEILSVPRHTSDGKIIVHTLDDTLVALDASRGSELWRISFPAPVLTLRGSSTPSATPSGIIAGLAGGKLVKLDPADGTPLWEVIITPPSGRSELARIADIDVDPVVVGNVVFVGTYNGDLAAVELASGTILWRRQLSSHAGLAADDVRLFITDSEDQIWAADPVDGAGRWKQDRLRYRRLTAPTLVGNLLAVGDLDGWVHFLAQSDGRLVGRTRISRAPITARPLTQSGRLIVYGTDGTLAVLSIGNASARGAAGSQTAATGAAAALSPPESGPTRQSSPSGRPAPPLTP